MPLAPPPYLLRVRDHLRAAEPGRWRWFASDEYTTEYGETVRLELLKSTYRMEPASHAKLYAVGARVAEALELEVPLTFYQAQGDGTMNAGLYFLPGEAHVVLRGRILATLGEAELAALVGHELAHYRLLTLDDGTLRVAQEVLESIAAHPGAGASYVTTALRARRWTELFADRGSHLACGAPEPVVGCLVKVTTGLGEVDPAAYIRQAEEIFAKKSVAPSGLSHPDTFVRARAIALWHEKREEAESVVAEMAQGKRSMDTLDLLDQTALVATTRAVVERILAPPWFRTDPVMAHARAFFPDLAGPGEASPSALTNDDDASIREYLAYVILDFAVVDESLGDAALAHGLREAAALDVAEVFEKIARDELKITKRTLDEAKKNAAAVVAKAEAQHGAES